MNNKNFNYGSKNLLSYAQDLDRAARIVGNSPYNKFNAYAIPQTLTQRPTNVGRELTLND